MEWLTENVAKLLILGILIVITVLFLKWSDKKKKEEDAAKKKYGDVTPQNINSLEDGELVNSVVAHRLEAYDDKDEKANKFLFTRKETSVITWNKAQDNVFFVWLACMHAKKIENADDAGENMVKKFVRLTYGELSSIGEAFTAIGADEIGALFQNMKTDSFDTAKIGAFKDLISKENPIKLCADYIRANPNEILADFEMVDNTLDHENSDTQ